MHILLGLLAAAAAVYFFMIRARHTIEVADEVADMAQTALGAARRFGFRRQANRHPVECIEEPQLAIAGLASAYLALDSYPTEDARKGLLLGLQSTLGVDLKEAEELASLGQWFVNACNGPEPAISRLSRKLHRLAGHQGLVDAMAVISPIAEKSGSDPSDKQIEALAEIKQMFKL